MRAVLRPRGGDDLVYSMEGNRVILTKANDAPTDEPFSTFG